MEFRLLGPVQISAAGQRLNIGDRKQRLVCAILLLAANRPVSIDRLSGLLWPDGPPPSGRRTVQAHLSRLRVALAAVPADDAGVTLDRFGTSYQLTCERQQVDAFMFRELLARARDAGDEERAALLDAALALWRGPALADVGTEEVRERLCHGLQESRLAATEERAEVYLRLGWHVLLLDDLTELSMRYPHRPRITGALMRALYRSGGVADALVAYERARRRLRDEWGLEPPADLRQLHLAILRGDDPVALDGVLR